MAQHFLKNWLQLGMFFFCMALQVSSVNAGIRQFSPEPVRVMIEGYAKDMRVADLNSDGFADIVTLHWEEGHRASIKELDPPNQEIKMNQGGFAVVRLADPAHPGSFLPAQYIFFGPFAVAGDRGFENGLNIADMDGDGCPDLLLLNGASFTVTIAYNDCTGHFPIEKRDLVKVRDRFFTPAKSWQMTALLVVPGDFDQDGRQDFAVMHHGLQYIGSIGLTEVYLPNFMVAPYLRDATGAYSMSKPFLTDLLESHNPLRRCYDSYFYTIDCKDGSGMLQREYYQLFASTTGRETQFIFRAGIGPGDSYSVLRLAGWDFIKNVTNTIAGGVDLPGALAMANSKNILLGKTADQGTLDLLCADGGAQVGFAPSFKPGVRGPAGVACGFGDFDRDGAIDLYQIVGNDLIVQYGDPAKPNDFTVDTSRSWSSVGSISLPWHENPVIARTGNFTGSRVGRSPTGLPYEDVAILGTDQVQIYYNIGEDQAFALSVGDIVPGIGAFPGDTITLYGNFAVGIPGAELININLNNGKGSQVSVARKDITLTKGPMPGMDTAVFTLPNLDADAYQLTVQNTKYSTPPKPYNVFSKTGMGVTVTKLSPNKQEYGNRVDIQGNNFGYMSTSEVSEIHIDGLGATAGASYIAMKGAGEGTFAFLNTSTVTLTLPFYKTYNWLPGDYNLSLKTLDGKTSNVATLTLFPDKPIITSVSSPKMLGQDVTIQGQGFDIGGTDPIFAVRLTGGMGSIQYSMGSGPGTFRFAGQDIILSLPNAGGSLTTGTYQLTVISNKGKTSDPVNLIIN